MCFVHFFMWHLDHTRHSSDLMKMKDDWRAVKRHVKMSVRQIKIKGWLVPAGQRDVLTGRVLLASFEQRSKQWVTPMDNTTIGVWRTVRVIRPVLILTLFYLVYSKITNFSLQAHFLEIFCKSPLKVKTERSETEGFWFGVFFCFEKWSAGNWLFLFFARVRSAVHWLVVLFYDLHEIICCIWYVLI